MKKIFPLLAILLLAGCGATKQLPVELSTETIEIDRDIEKTFEFAHNTAIELNWQKIQLDAKKHAFTATVPKEDDRGEEKVNVFITKTDKGSMVTVMSKMGNEASKEDIKSYLNLIQKASKKRMITITGTIGDMK